MWLIIHAAYKTHPIGTKGKTIQLERGQIPVGRDYLAKVWGWGPQKVRTFLAQLQNEGMAKITQPDRHSPNILTICNYNKFQSSSEKASRPSNRPTTTQQPYSTKDTKIQKENISHAVVEVEKREATTVHPDDDAWDSVRWVPGGRLEVVNGERAYLLQQVGGDETAANRHLERMAPYVGKKLRGIKLTLAYRSRLAQQLEWDRQNQKRREASSPRPQSNNPSQELLDLYARAAEERPRMFRRRETAS